MKRILIFCAWAAVGSCVAQPALSPSSPAVAPSTGAISVDNPAATLLGINGVATPTGAVTNLTLNDVALALQDLQVSMEQTLPVIAVFNDSFDFTNVQPANLGSNFGVNFSANQGSNFAANLGTNVAAPSLGAAAVSGPAAVPRDTMRALLVLQSDVERILPVLNALNGGTNVPSAALPPGFTPGVFTNVFNVTPPPQ